MERSPESREATTIKAYKSAGRYVRSTDPAMVRRLKREGEATDAESLGRMLAESDPDTFARIVDTSGKLIVY